jgi:glycosyltransferase involved in cell wall biosynthesis
MSERPAIVVLTPLKNDAWILRRFLEVTSVFADLIIVADQGSTDGGLEICREFDKVTVIDNSKSNYDEASRQELLIATARQLVPLPRILMALDSDEVLTADSLHSADWQRMLAAPAGTAIFFEKPNVYLSLALSERRPLDFLGAFIDDGTTKHQAKRVHSPRLPAPPGGPTLVLQDVKFLHYALARPDAQKAKIRMYAVLENLMGTKSAYWRRRYYWSHRVLKPLGPVAPTPRAWLEGWEKRGIDMTSIEDVQPYWQDLATLDLLLEHGSRRFWFDDIWQKDWKRLQAETHRTGRLHPPPWLFRVTINTAHRLLETAASLRQRLFRSRLAT